MICKVLSPNGLILTDLPGNNNPIDFVHNGEIIEKIDNIIRDNILYAKIITSFGQEGYIIESKNNIDNLEYLENNDIMPLIAGEDDVNYVATITEDSPQEDSSNSYEEEELGESYQPDISEIIENKYQVASDNPISNISSVIGIFGLPYQFLPDTDMRVNVDSQGNGKVEDLGCSYMDKIIGNMPIVFLTPGRANFLTQYDKSAQEGVLGLLSDAGITDGGGSMSDILDGKNGRYYTFEPKFVDYYNFVNPACRNAAMLYGVGDLSIPTPNGGNQMLQFIDWQQYVQGGFKLISTSWEAVPLYVDSDVSVSESFSTSTTQSSLANTINSISDMGRELGFLLGYGSKALGKAIDSDETIRNLIDSTSNTISNLFGNGNFMKNLTAHVKTVAAGGKLLFPEIWQDSTFSKSYDIKVKLVSPNCSKLSVFLNIIVPIIHLLCMVAPQSTDDNPNGYHSPFLVRGVYKGLWNVDMGIITNMSVEKGAEGMWTPEGVPTVAEVSLTIKDLYECALTVTPGIGTGGDFKYNTVTNTALMDYLCNLTGVSIYEPEVARNVYMDIVNKGNGLIDPIRNIWKNAQESISNNITNIFNGRQY